MPGFDERYFQVFRPGGITPVQASDFDEALSEFAEIVQDLIVAGDKKREENWATPLAGQTFSVRVREVQTEEEQEMSVTIEPRTTDLSDHAKHFDGPQQTVKRGG